MEEFKPNSFRSKEETKKSDEQKPEIKPVISGTAKVKKKTGWDKFKEAFVSDEGKGVGEYLVYDVLIPALKKTISDLINNGTDMVLYGNSRRSQSNMPVNRVSYARYYSDGANQRNNGGYSSRRNAYSYDEIILQNRAEAENVLIEMDNIIRQYGYVRVSDLYDLVGLTASYTDSNYGWSDLRSSDVIRERDGYLLKFPKPMPID